MGTAIGAGFEEKMANAFHVAYKKGTAVHRVHGTDGAPRADRLENAIVISE